MIPRPLLAEAGKNIRDILSAAIGYKNEKSVVVFDSQSALSRILTEAYRSCLPEAQFLDFDSLEPEKILKILKSLKASDLAVLIQSANFRLEAFRLRVELFNQSIKVIEHPHLANMANETEALYYLQSLAYDPDYYRMTGKKLKEKIDRAKSGLVASGNGSLSFLSGFEPAKLNIGDYSGMKNIGGQFPIGEVFTESKNLEDVCGRVQIFAFGDTSFKVSIPQKTPILIVEKGRVVNTIDSNPELEIVLENIRRDEGEIWLRELGLGLNRAFTRERVVADIGTYERMCGIHLSLGAKHTIYKKPNFTRRQAKHHVDVFVDTEYVRLDNETVYRQGAWTV